MPDHGVAWNPLAPSFVADPYPVYRALRDADPYHLSEATGEFVISRYEDVDQILRDWRRFSNERGSDRIQTPETDTSILQRDPADHTRLRALVSRAFTPRRIASMEHHIRETAHALLDEVAGRDEFDLMSNLAALLPTVVIAEMIGIPTSDREQFKAWSDAFIRISDRTSAPDEVERGLTAAKALYEYFAGQVERRRHAPADDLISQLITAREEQDQLSEHEMILTLTLLLLAGNETTTNLLSNGLKALLEHPEQLQTLRDHPEMIDKAIEELLRYDSPVQLDPRLTTKEVVLGGKSLVPGQPVTLVIGGANRDPERFSAPETLDITREDAGNISFGRGIHFCLGAPLARLEGKIAFECMFERFDDIQFGSRKPEYRPNLALRGLKHFDIAVRRRAG